MIIYGTFQQHRVRETINPWVKAAALSPLPKPSNPSHYLGDMHEIDYRNHQAFQA